MSTSSTQNINCPVCNEPGGTIKELNLVTGRSVIYCDHGPVSVTDETDILICDCCELPIAPGDENPRTFKGDPYCFCSECIIQAEDWFQGEFGDD